MRKALAVVIVCLAGIVPALAEEIRFVGKSVMFSNYVIIRSLLDSRDHKSFVRAARSVDLDQPLLKPGLITVFAPTDAAFSDLSPKWKAKILDTPRREAVARLLACHIVTDPRFAGRKLADLLIGTETLSIPTLGGCGLTVSRVAGGFALVDGAGRRSIIAHADILQSNGMIQIVDAVLLPSS